MSVLANKFVEFIRNTISGHESGLYKLMFGGKLPYNRNIIVTPAVLSIIVSFAENYFNSMYESLISKDDDYINENFKVFCSQGHSEVCIINILARLTLDVHLKLDRSRLDISDYSNYMASLNVLLDAELSPLFEKIKSSFTHTCTGSKAEPLGKKMFTLKI